MEAEDKDRLVRAISECKGVLRHSWYPTTTDRKAEFGTYIANRCERCGTERLMVVGPLGQRVSGWRYVHTDEVLFKSITADSMDEWRTRYVQNLMQDMIKARRDRRNR